MSSELKHSHFSLKTYSADFHCLQLSEVSELSPSLFEIDGENPPADQRIKKS